MVSWVWIPIALFVGIIFGIMLIAIVGYSNRGDE